MVTIAPFADREAAEKTKASLPDSLIPQSILNQLEQSANPRQTGIDICAEILTAISKIPGISGANILVDEDVSAAAEVVTAFQATQPS